MGKGLKITFKTLGWTLVIVFLLILSAMVALQSPAIQSFIGRQVVERLRGSIDADIQFGEVSFKPVEALIIKDVLVTDPAAVSHKADTVFRAKHLSAKFSIRGLFSDEGVHVSRLLLQDAGFNLVIEPDSASGKTTTNLQRIFRIPVTEEAPEPQDLGNLFDARLVEARDLRFRLINPVGEQQMAERGESYPEGVINWNNLDAWVSQLKARDIRYAHNIITLTVDQLRLGEDQTGFVVENASGKVKVGNRQALIQDLEITESDSYIHAEKLLLDGPLEDYGDFIEKIRIEADILPGTLVSMKSVCHFGPLPEGTSFRGYLQGHAEGTVSDFLLSGVSVQDPDNGIQLQVDGGMKGLPYIETSTTDFRIGNLEFTLPGLAGFVKSWAPETELDLSSLAKGENFRFTGTVQGPMNRLAVKGKIAPDNGDAQVDMLLSNVVDGKKDIGFDGSLQTRELDLGRLLGVGELGSVTLQSRLKATLTAKGPQLQMDTLHISRIKALDYTYSDISGSLTYQGDSFEGNIVSADPNISFLLHGAGRPGANGATDYHLFLSLGYADLNALNFDKRGTSRVSFMADSRLSMASADDFSGDLLIQGLSLENDSGIHELGDLTLTAKAAAREQRMELQSDFLDASYAGGKAVTDFVSDLKSLIVDTELPALPDQFSPAWDGTEYNFSLLAKDSRELLDFVLPGLYIENGTRLGASVNKDGLLQVRLHSGRLAFLDKYLRDVDLTVDNGTSALQADLVSPSLYLSGLELKGNRLSLFANDNHLGLSYSFDNEAEAQTRAELILGADLSREAGELVVDAQALPSNFYFEGNGWGISSDRILYKGGEWKVERLVASHEDEILLVDGGFSPARQDTLNVKMEKFDLSLVNTFTGGLFPLQGQATGEALVISPSSPAVGLLASITCDSTRVSGKRLGQVQIQSVWNETENRFDMNVGNSLDGKRTIGIAGYLKPDTARMSAEATLDGLSLEYAGPLLEGVFSEFGGKLSGVLRAEGPFQDLALSSRGLRLDDGRIALDFTQVPYHVSGSLDLDNKGLHFTDVRLRDQYDGNGTLRGSILLDGFSRYGLDVHVRVNRMKVLELKRGMNSLLYGDISATGTADVTGWSPDLNIDLAAATAGSGNLHLLIGSSSGNQSRELLTFVEPQEETVLDPYEQMMATNASRTQRITGNTGIRLNVRPSQDVMVYIDLSEENSLMASGTGDIEIDSQSSTKSLTLNGNYLLSQGSFHFSALNLVSRDFTIQDGSTVHFNGDLWDTELDVNGLYTTKASLANLISDENAVTRRTVNCGIGITDKLRNPQVKFSIDIPDLNPTTQAEVAAALNTDDKVQKQFLYLLLAGGFLPSEESGITTNGSEVLLSNVTGIMAGQLNNIFEKLNIPLDLGLNYQSTSTGTNIFDVALSTQLFNNRVIVNGSVGNKQLYGTTTSEVAGDIDIEIKLNQSGSLRANLFSHSADQFTSYLDNSQRNGGGIAYQREFNTFSQFIRELFTPRRSSGRPADERPRQERDSTQIRRERPRSGNMDNSRMRVLQIDSTGQAIIKNEQLR